MTAKLSERLRASPCASDETVCSTQIWADEAAALEAEVERLRGEYTRGRQEAIAEFREKVAAKRDAVPPGATEFDLLASAAKDGAWFWADNEARAIAAEAKAALVPALVAALKSYVHSSYIGGDKNDWALVAKADALGVVSRCRASSCGHCREAAKKAGVP